MKLYREATPLEINSNKAFYGGAIGFGFFVPVEITEEEIDKAAYKAADYPNHIDGEACANFEDGFIDGAKWVLLLSKLKGE